MESVITLLLQGGICLQAVDPINTSLNWTLAVVVPVHSYKHVFAASSLLMTQNYSNNECCAIVSFT